LRFQSRLLGQKLLDFFRVAHITSKGRQLFPVSQELVLALFARAVSRSMITTSLSNHPSHEIR
jgi:hypothetical protein